MMAAELDDREARSLLRNIKAVASDVRVMRDVAGRMKQQVYEGFRHEKAPSGVPWPPLAPATLAARGRRGNHSTQPLIDSGLMYGSITAASAANEASVTIGGGVPDERTWWSQFGTARAPAREMLPFSDSIDSEWFDRIIEPIDAAFGAAIA